MRSGQHVEADVGLFCKEVVYVLLTGALPSSMDVQ